MAPLKRLNDNFTYTNRSAMRDQITLMQPSTTNNPDGSSPGQSVFAQNVWASCKLWRYGREVNSADLVQGEVYWDVRIPYMDGVNDQMNVVGPNGENWFIVSVSDPDMRQVELRMMCREINSGGVTTDVDEVVSGGTF